MKKQTLKQTFLVVLAFLIVLLPLAANAQSNTTINKSPKYVFYIIGDGMGETHLEIGRIFNKVMQGNMQAEPSYMDFPINVTVKGGVDSSQGGTMLATGEKLKAGLISSTEKGDELRTILDVAKDNGYKTGVVTNASITDATPAAFMSHAVNRSLLVAISRDIVESNVDFIAGGGLDKMYAKDDLPKALSTDCAGDKLTSFGSLSLAPKLEDADYTTYFGTPGAQAFLSEDTVMQGKTITAFAKGNLPFYYLQKTINYSERMVNTPSLSEMTKKGIENLSESNEGFVMVVEQSAIDDSSHLRNTNYIAAEMGVLEETLRVVIDFYNENPNETLIVLTADHETGKHTMPKDALDPMLEVKNGVPWDGSQEEMRNYFHEHFGVSVSKRVLTDTFSFIENNSFESTFDNRLIGTSEITAKVQFALGIRQNSDYHSKQQVPLLVMGVGSEQFETSESIADIPNIICDIAGWENTLGLFE